MPKHHKMKKHREDTHGVFSTLDTPHNTFPGLIVTWGQTESDVIAGFRGGVPSIYDGLTVKEQEKLSKMRRGGAVKCPKAILRSLHKAKKDDYIKLYNACVNGLIFGGDFAVDRRLDRLFIYMRVLYTYKYNYSSAMPPLKNIAYDDWTILKRVPIDSMVDYLHSIGISKMDHKELRRNLWKMKQHNEDILFRNTYAVDESIAALYNELFCDDVEEKIDSQQRGRTRHKRNFSAVREALAEQAIDNTDEM